MDTAPNEFCWDPVTACRQDLVDLAKVAQTAAVQGRVEGNVLTTDLRKWIRQGIPRMRGYNVKRKNIAEACRGASEMMEIGFNTGFSATLLLTSNPRAHLTIFDLGCHPYVVPCYRWVQAHFPDRTTLILGDSTKTVPEFIEKNPQRKFDFIHVDGGHGERVATSDIRQSLRLLAKKSTMVVDDTQYQPVRKAMAKFSQLSISPSNDMSEFRHETQNMVFQFE